jgi:hypothetical protein
MLAQISITGLIWCLVTSSEENQQWRYCWFVQFYFSQVMHVLPWLIFSVSIFTSFFGNEMGLQAANIFYYLTYEGAVDLDTMEDELQRSAIEDQIANFGQTPIQIFRKKHPRRGPPIPIARPLYFAPDSINLSSIVSSTSHPPSAVLYVGTLDSNIVLVNQGLTLSVKMWLTTQLQSGGNFTFSSFQVECIFSCRLLIVPRNF